MKPTTKEQRKAMKAVFDRVPLYIKKDAAGRTGCVTASDVVQKAGWHFHHDPDNTRALCYWHHDKVSPKYAEASSIVEAYRLAIPMTYLQFRRLIQQGYDCLMVPWAGMWLGIEKDGYTHS